MVTHLVLKLGTRLTLGSTLGTKLRTAPGSELGFNKLGTLLGAKLGDKLGLTFEIKLGPVLGNKHCCQLWTKLSFGLGSALGA